jgi:hypothetical protein
MEKTTQLFDCLIFSRRTQAMSQVDLDQCITFAG